MASYLIVANQTLPSALLRDAVQERRAAGDATFYVVVPATKAGRNFTWDEDESRRQARERLDAYLASLEAEGISATGEVGDSDPIEAVRDAIRGRDVDEILLSTLPPGISRWIGQDVPSRLRGVVTTPVTVIHQPAETVAGR
ncbi:MAG: hypothetical protein ACJ761_04100 [Chloroflexota bacterium]